MRYDIINNKISGIYMIHSLVDNKRYIGSSLNIRGRLRGHINSLNRNLHDNPYLQNSWNKYGKDNFISEILELCPKELLIIREDYYMNLYNTKDRNFGFNLREACNPGYDKPSPNKGKKMSEEQKVKISNTLRGRKVPRDIVEKSANSRRGKPSGMSGKKASEETKRKLSEVKKGKPKPEGFGDKISEILKGRIFSKEHKLNISKSKSGIPSKLKGKKMPEDQKLRMLESRKRKKS